MIRSLVAALAIVTCVPALTACSSTATSESTGQYVDSSVITAKVHTAIARSDKLSVFDIGVTTYKDVVQLSGYVDSEDQKELAGKLARGVAGVKEVHNNIQIKPGSSS